MTEPVFRLLSTGRPRPGLQQAFTLWRAGEELSQWLGSRVVLAGAGEATASLLLNAGARQVLLGEAALRDSQMVERLARRFGPERIGVFVPVARQAVHWSFGDRSNADFSVVTPSLGEPAWEVLLADQRPSGALARWWVVEMLRRGIGTVLLCADIDDDTELNLCADLVELAGDKLWVTPRMQKNPPLNEWIAFGQLQQIALPASLYDRLGHHYSPTVVAQLRTQGVTA